ncbi:hypothetical protein HWI79_783 [Cryptosporidium felis]|nr:hypothetical protein HWI79_783 [Cryptosporidium felis]
MDSSNSVPEMIFMDNIESNLMLLSENENSNNQSGYSLKENYPNINAQLKVCSNNHLSISQANKSCINGRNYLPNESVPESFNQELSQGMNMDSTDGEYFPHSNDFKNSGYRNFKLEWDRENDALYIVIPSVDSLDHWMMLFLQPLGITSESLCMNNCCKMGNCDFRIRLDDERLLLYPDLLKDISDYIRIQSKKWQYYSSSVILSDLDREIDFRKDDYSKDRYINQYDNELLNMNNLKLPDINVFLDDQSQANDYFEPIANSPSYELPRKESFLRTGTDFDQSKKQINECNIDIYGKCILIPDVCSKIRDPTISNNSISCLTTNIPDSNILTSDSGILQVLTSENSNHDENYFSLNQSNSTGVENEECFPIEAR